MGISAKHAVILMLLSIALAACAGGDDGRSVGLFGGGDKFPNPPFTSHHPTEFVAFLKTYLNNPVGVRDAAIAEPAPRDISGKTRYVACLRYSLRASDRRYAEP